MEKETKKSSGRGGRRPGAGRPKGSLDQGNKALREMILAALQGVGGVAYLQGVAESHPGPFLSLLGKVLPTQVTGENGEPIKTESMLDVSGLSTEQLRALASIPVQRG